MIYFARPISGSLTLAVEEHRDIRWCSPEALEELDPPMSGAVKWYCRKAIEEVSASSAGTSPLAGQ
jgi:8-oxo-dGTP pyrophosphatase MutT (NUDIX family)